MQLLKNLLRRELICRRKELDRLWKHQADERIFRSIIGLEEFNKADIILCYVSLPSEVGTEAIIDYALGQGKITAVPRCEGNIMRFHVIASRNELKKGAFGIPEPDSDAPVVESFRNAICVVPALCFNENGQRIGYGKGYYDRFLSESGCYSVGICYEDFICSFPVEAHDRAVNVIITDKGTPRRVYESEPAR